MIPKDIQEKIEAECAENYGTHETHPHLYGQQREGFKKGAEYGYSLAQEEIDRLKKLVETAYAMGWLCSPSDEIEALMPGNNLDTKWQQFKQQRKL